MAVPNSEAPSAVEAFPALWRRVMTDPHGFFTEMPETGGLGQPTGFLATCAAINAVGHLLVGSGARAAVAIFAGQLVAAALVASVFVLVAQNFFGGRAGFEATFRVVAYASAPLVVFWVPVVGTFAWLYDAYLLVRGLERIHGLDVTRTLLTLGIGILVLWLLRDAFTGRPVWP